MQRHEGMPPLDFGFQDITMDRHESIQENAAHDQALSPVMEERHDMLPPLDLGFREPVLDVLNRAYSTMERAIEKLQEFDVEGNPARDWARRQIQACSQMQALYRQMALHRRTRRGVMRTLHLVRTVGPAHEE